MLTDSIYALTMWEASIRKVFKPVWILMKQGIRWQWQWHHLDHMHIICTSLQTHNHTSSLSLNSLQTGCSSWRPSNDVWVSNWVTNLWSVEIRIGLLHFQAGCRKRRLNLALVFLHLFCVVVHFFWLVNACFCCVGFSFCVPSQEIGLWNVYKMTCFVLRGT